VLVEGETRYTRSGDLNIAYQVLGDGPIDLVWAPGYMSHLEQNQWWPEYATFLERLASFSRLIMFDRRGTGLSDRILALGSFEFAERGTHVLKGVPGEWHLHAVTAAA